MRMSTSYHNINADYRLSMIGKALYLIANLANNSIFPNSFDEILNIRDFSPAISQQDWNKLPVKSSPVRKLSELFWLKLPWDLVESEVGGINMVDVGCGSGNYGVRLLSFSNNRISKYTGLDTNFNQNWKVLEDRFSIFTFKKANSASILNHIPEDTNVIVSQSAVEHFDEDLSFFIQVRDFILRNANNTVQIHLLPPSSCLKLYLFHGVRQYTPRTLAKIARLFSGFSYCVLFRLGSKECNALHYNYITKPLLLKKGEDLRETRTMEYDQRLFKAIKRSTQRLQNSPTFYALVIHSYWKEKIFLE